MNSNNVISFGKPAETQNTPDVDKNILSLKSSYCDEMSNELFGILMRIIERSGHMDGVDTEDEGFFNDLQPRLAMVKESLYAVFCLLENVDYDLSIVFDNLYDPIGYTEDGINTHLFVSVNNKYRDKLIEITKEYLKNKEDNG
jgi:hypothetical protein